MAAFSSNPILDAMQMHLEILVSSLATKVGLGTITATVSVDSPLEVTVFKEKVEPPQQVVPLVQHGVPVKGVVTLVAPLGVSTPSVVSGLTVRLHIAKYVKSGGPPVLTDEIKQMPKWMHPKATPITYTYDMPLFVTDETVLLKPGGHYEIAANGEIRVPFEIGTADVPTIESFEAEDGSGVCHWVEAHIEAVGVRGRVARFRAWWGDLTMTNAKARLQMQKKGGAGAMFAKMGNQTGEGVYWQPGGKQCEPFRRLAIQVVAPPASGSQGAATAEATAAATAEPWLTMMELGPWKHPHMSAKLSKIVWHMDEGKVTGQLDVSTAPPVKLGKIELQLLTVLGGGGDTAPPETVHVTASTVVYPQSPPDADTASADAPGAEAAAATNTASSTSTTAATGAPVALSTAVSLDVSELVRQPAMKLCVGHKPDPLDYPLEEAEDGATRFGPEEAVKPPIYRLPVPCKLEHKIRLTLTSADGEHVSSNTVDVPLMAPGRPQLTGAPAGTLVAGVPPPPPPKMSLLAKMALFILGLLTFVISLSFMMPVKFEWMVTRIGMQDWAQYCGLLPPKEGEKQGWMRSILATATQTVKRFLTGHR